MDETMIKVAELREGDTFEVFGGVFSAVRIWGGGDLRTVHLEAWAQGEGAELKLRNAMFVRLVSRVPDEDLRRAQDERTAASLASFDALVREIDEAPDAPDDGLAHDDWEVPPSPDAVAQVREALRRADHALAGLRNALIVERELQARCAELERERDEARAELKRYTDVYADPDAGPSFSDLCGHEEVDERPLTGLALAADQMIKQTLAGVTPSVPEPPPRAGGALVTPLVLAWIASQRANVGQERVDQALRLVMERDAFGRTKYPQGLALEDGRNTFEDLRQELGDALQYGLKLRVEGVEGERLEEVRWLAHLLWILMCADKVEVGP